MKKQELNSQAMVPEQTTMKPFSELNMIDDFMFDIATEDLETCKAIVEICLNVRLREIRWKENQKPIHNSTGKRGVRLDFYVVDMEGKIYDVEMQARKAGNLPKRTRFYTALLDSPALKSGERGFDNLPPTYVIFICGFDLFGYGKYRYTFEDRCKEVPELTLKNELQTVFLNTKGTNPEEVEPALVEFLKFVENSSEGFLPTIKDDRVRRMSARILDLKSRSELEISYMKMEERDRLLEEKGKRIGRIEGEKAGRIEGERNRLISQVQKKLAKNHSPAEIADALEEDESVILALIEEIQGDQE